MKKAFTKPSMSVSSFDSENIITTSIAGTEATPQDIQSGYKTIMTSWETTGDILEFN